MQRESALRGALGKPSLYTDLMGGFHLLCSNHTSSSQTALVRDGFFMRCIKKSSLTRSVAPPLKIVTADAVKMLASGAGRGYTVGRRYIPDRSTKEEGL